MRAQFAILVLLILPLSGCIQSNTTPDSGFRDVQHDDQHNTSTPDAGFEEGHHDDAQHNASTTNVTLHVEDQQLTTKEATVTLRGFVTPAALVSFAADDDQATLPKAQEFNGNWSVQIQVPFGATNITVSADAGGSLASINVSVIRLALVTMQVTYRGAIGMTDRNDSYWINIDDHVSADQYEGCAQKHPDYANAHDAMMAWSQQLHRDVTYSDCGDFGVMVEAIEGYESPGYWCYEINGEPADVGISLQRIEPGDVVHWDDCTLVLV